MSGDERIELLRSIRGIKSLEMIRDREVLEHQNRATRRRPVQLARNELRPIWCQPGHLVVGVAGDAPTTLVNEAMVLRTEGDEVIQVGGPAVRPVDKMMNVDPAFPATTRVATAAVPSLIS